MEGFAVDEGMRSCADCIVVVIGIPWCFVGGGWSFLLSSPLPLPVPFPLPSMLPSTSKPITLLNIQTTPTLPPDRNTAALKTMISYPLMYPATQHPSVPPF